MQWKHSKLKRARERKKKSPNTCWYQKFEPVNEKRITFTYIMQLWQLRNHGEQHEAHVNEKMEVVMSSVQGRYQKPTSWVKQLILAYKTMGKHNKNFLVAENCSPPSICENERKNFTSHTCSHCVYFECPSSSKVINGAPLSQCQKKNDTWTAWAVDRTIQTALWSTFVKVHTFAVERTGMLKSIKCTTITISVYHSQKPRALTQVSFGFVGFDGIWDELAQTKPKNAT